MEKKKGGIVVLITDKIDFKSKGIVRHKARALHNDKGNNPTRGYNPSKHLCNQHRNTYLYNASLDEH